MFIHNYIDFVRQPNDNLILKNNDPNTETFENQSKRIATHCRTRLYSDMEHAFNIFGSDARWKFQLGTWGTTFFATSDIIRYDLC